MSFHFENFVLINVFNIEKIDIEKNVHIKSTAIVSVNKKKILVHVGLVLVQFSANSY